MAGLKKKGPKHKQRNYKSWKDQTKKPLITVDELKEEDEEFDEFERMMKEGHSYRRHNGAYRQVR